MDALSGTLRCLLSRRSQEQILEVICLFCLVAVVSLEYDLDLQSFLMRDKLSFSLSLVQEEDVARAHEDASRLPRPACQD